jgi:peptidoglycan/LPS O-acetylase OafA/YrhL
MSIETPPQTQRLQNIQALRGIAALFVAFSHLLIMEQKYSDDQILGVWIELGMVGVDLFFVISGFIMVHVAWNLSRGLRSVSEFLFARAGRIYPLYWLISFLTLCVWLWKPEIVFSSSAGSPDFITSFLLLPDVTFPFLAIGWTLIHEVFFYLIFALALFLKPKWLLPFLIGWTIVLTIGILNKLTDLSPLMAILFNPLSYEFLLGAFAAWILKTYNAPLVKTAAVLGLLLSGAALFYSYVYHCGMPSTFGDRAMYFGLPAALVVYGFAGIERGGNVLSTKLSRLGDWSYSLYLTHILSLSLLGRLWNQIARPGPWDNIVLLTLMPVFAVFVSYLCWRFAEKPMLDMVKRARVKLFPR